MKRKGLFLNIDLDLQEWLRARAERENRPIGWELELILYQAKEQETQKNCASEYEVVNNAS